MFLGSWPQVSLLEWGVGQGDVQRSLPASRVLRFCDSRFSFPAGNTLYPLLEMSGCCSSGVVDSGPGDSQTAVRPALAFCSSDPLKCQTDCRHKRVGESVPLHTCCRRERCVPPALPATIPPKSRSKFFIPADNLLYFYHCILVLVNVLIINRVCSPVLCFICFTVLPVHSSQCCAAFPKLTRAPVAASSSSC